MDVLVGIYRYVLVLKKADKRDIVKCPAVVIDCLEISISDSIHEASGKYSWSPLANNTLVFLLSTGND